ncbi:DUF3224 domain-containing protein [Actinopolymorpha singaporensis]|uniref:DUF3224 domain-containing protein n=1 Tax=Actinopolymorpha singaporensis TaxID=117157 RepID=A0A1H1LVK4_9ACTN|nr:DUF3224 domain-containing protein [Actinopolymorpha singaporensis]SDR78322.1 Protein of unknown function [Actinopolymorpha singaporensis]
MSASSNAPAPSTPSATTVTASAAGDRRAGTEPGGTFASTAWEETRPEPDEESPRVAHAYTTNTFTGAIDGTGTAHHVMFYGPGEGQWGAGRYHGYEKVTGTVGGRTGSFVLAHDGAFAGTTVRADWTVVPGSATGELAGLRGRGSFVAEQGVGAVVYTFDHTFDERQH